MSKLISNKINAGSNTGVASKNRSAKSFRSNKEEKLYWIL